MAVLALCSLLSSGCRSSDQPASFADALLTDIKEFSHPVIARAGLTPAELRAGDSATLVAAIKIKPGWHIYAPGGALRYTIPTRMETKLPEGMSATSDWTYPKGTLNGEDLVYEGSVVLTLPLGADQDLGPGRRSLVCSIYYVACEGMRCLPPEGQALQVDFEIVK